MSHRSYEMLSILQEKKKTTVLEWVRSILGKVLSCLIFTEIYLDNKDLVKIQ